MADQFEAYVRQLWISARGLMLFPEIFMLSLRVLSQPAQSFRQSLFALMRIVGQNMFLVRQVCQKPEPFHTGSRDPVMVDICGTVQELAKIIPVEVPAVLKLL
jgi:hypothetical protein